VLICRLAGAGVLVDGTSALQEQVQRPIDPETGIRAAAVAVLAGSVVRITA
jgi:hypothetical protein